MKLESDTQNTEVEAAERTDIQAEPVERIPTLFKPFAGKTPAQFFEKYFPRDKVEALAGAMAGFVDLGMPIPEWAKKSSILFWRNYIGDKPLEPAKSAEDFGVMVKMIEFYTKGRFSQPKPIKPQSKLGKFLDGIIGKLYSLLMGKIVTEFSDSEKIQFYTGCVRAEQIFEKFENPQYLAMLKRPKVYLNIAANWKKIEGFKTTAERIRWLEGVDGTDLTEREFYSVFENIGLPGAAPGRPKMVET